MLNFNQKAYFFQGFFFEKGVYFLLVIIAFCLPLFPKGATFAIGAAVMMALADNVLSGSFKMATPGSFFLLLAFAFWAALSLFNSPDFAASYYNFQVLVPQYIFLYWLTISYVKTDRQSYGIVAALLLSGFFVASYGVYQYFYDGTMVTSGWVDSTYFPTIKTRAFSTLYNPNILASFLVTSLALCFGGIFSKVRVSVQMALVLLAFISLLCLLFTFSRTAWVSLLAVALAVCAFYSYRILYTLVPVAFFGIFLAKDMLMERFLSVFQSADTSSLLRFALWESTFAMIRDNPLTGIGWGAYRFVYPHYDFFINNPDVIIYHAHNMYFNIAAELGIPGLLIFMLLLLVHFYFAFNVMKSKTSVGKKALAIGLCCSFIGIIVGGITDHTLFNMELASIYWLICALSFSLWKMNKKQAIY